MPGMRARLRMDSTMASGTRLNTTLAPIERFWSLLRDDPALSHSHPDPATSPVPEDFPAWHAALLGSASMAAFASVLRTDAQPDHRECVLSELEEYWHRDRAETLQRCLNWEQYSVAEWKSADRDSPEGLLAFYQQCESWAYDLLWYDMLRAKGLAIPTPVAIMDWLAARNVTGRHLDFGSGVGTTGMAFACLGWDSTLGDISEPLLNFASWRAEQHGVAVGRLDLRDPLPVGAYDVVTAVDAFAHVPNPAEVARALHAALLPGGYLFTDFDIREPSDSSAWHLHDNPYGLMRALLDAGFDPVDRLADGVVHVYRRREPGVPRTLRRALADAWTCGGHRVALTRARRRAVRLARHATRAVSAPVH